MIIQVELAAWMVIPLTTTIGCVMLAFKMADSEDGWDAVTLAFIVWFVMTLPALLVALLK